MLIIALLSEPPISVGADASNCSHAAEVEMPPPCRYQQFGAICRTSLTATSARGIKREASAGKDENNGDANVSLENTDSCRGVHRARDHRLSAGRVLLGCRTSAIRRALRLEIRK